MDNDIKWVCIFKGIYVAVEYDKIRNEYIYYLDDNSIDFNGIFGYSKNPPLRLEENEPIIRGIKKYCYDIQKLQKIKLELQDTLKEDTKPEDINPEYIPEELKKHNNNISEMLNNNIPEYVGDKNNLVTLLLTLIAVKTGLASYIVNVTGETLAGKTTLIKNFFNLIPDETIKYHNNSTLSGIVRGSEINPITNGSILYLGNITKKRNKELTLIEELSINLYKDKKNVSYMGAKSNKDNSINVNIETDTFMSIYKSITPRKSPNIDINAITTYLTVKPVPKEELVQELQIANKKNNKEFIKQHKEYINSLEDTNNIKEELFNNKELVNYIVDSTKELTYEELFKYEMLYCSYCIYLNITPSIESFKKFQKLTLINTVLTEQEEQFIEFLNNKYTDKNITLGSKARKDFKYFSIDMLETYYGNIKIIKDLKETNKLEELINSLVIKGELIINDAGLFYLNK